MSRPDRDHAGDLEQHRSWLRVLAHHLVVDPHQAEDCVQDVFLAALRNPPSDPTTLRGWLVRTLRNMARKAYAKETDRRHHERSAASERRAPPTGDIHGELQGSLTRAIDELDERYRRVLLMRYDEDLPPREIAVRMNVPVKTVNSQLYRALQRLRERLDEHHGDRRTWVVLALDIDGAPVRSSPAPSPPMLSGKLPFAAAALVVTLTALVWWTTRERDEPVLAGLTPASDTSAPDAPLEAPARPAPRAETVPQPVPSIDPPGSSFPTWTGRVEDVGGNALDDVLVTFEPQLDLQPTLQSGRELPELAEMIEERRGNKTTGAPTSNARSDPDGRFQLVPSTDVGWVRAHGPEWISVVEPFVREPVHDELLVVVAPPRQLEGRVVDESGEPVSRARVQVRLPDELQLKIRASTPRRLQEPLQLTGTDGRYAFADVADVPGAWLRVTCDGYRDERVELGEGDLTLTSALVAEAPNGFVGGRVLDPDGQALAGAWLSVGWKLGRTDADGRFRISVPAGLTAAPLIVAATGYLPVRRRLLRGAQGSWGADFDVRVQQASLSISGVVLTKEGTPHADVSVWAPHPEALGVQSGSRHPMLIEHVLRAAREDGAMFSTRTDAEGRFVLDGLQKRDYVLRVLDRDAFVLFDTELLPAGSSDVTLRFPTDNDERWIAGVVLAVDGTEVPDVHISTSCTILETPLPWGSVYRTTTTGPTVTTDGDGVFVTSTAERGDILLVAHGNGVENRRFDIKAGEDLENLELTVGRTCRVQVVRSAGAPEFGRFALHTAFDAPVALRPTTGNTLVGQTFVEMPQERSPVMRTHDLACELVLLNGDRIIGRRPLSLIPGELNVITVD